MTPYRERLLAGEHDAKKQAAKTPAKPEATKPKAPSK